MSGPVPLRLRPLEVGDLLDETFRIYRRNFALFAGISVILAIPQAVLAGYLSFSALDMFTQLATPAQPVDLGRLEGVLAAELIALLIEVALAPFLYGAVTYAAGEAAQGRAVTAAGVIRGVLGRYFQILGYLALFVGMGILFCLFPLWIWIGVGWVAVIPIMFIENAGLGAAMGRSRHLVQGSWWRTFLILFLMFIIILFVNLALSAFAGLAEGLIGIFAASAVVAAVATGARVLVQSLVNPAFQILIVLIYFDLRVRREGLDLFQLAQRVLPPAPAV
ncbi:MAG: hypothetical protein ACHQ0J_02660 [Candidatus Dormibacterales bacterium]